MVHFRTFHPFLWKNSSVIISNQRQHSFEMFRSSSLDRMDQLLIQYVLLNITCKIELKFDLWNTTSFLQSHTAQQNAATPTNTLFFCLFEKLLSQGPKRLNILAGVLIPKVKLNVIHSKLVIATSSEISSTVNCSTFHGNNLT
jgi:hypothetical protein